MTTYSPGTLKSRLQAAHDYESALDRLWLLRGIDTDLYKEGVKHAEATRAAVRAELERGRNLL